MKLRGAVIVACMAALGVASVGAASASAEGPVWWECAKEAGGKLKKGCIEEGGTGGWTLKPGIGSGKTFSAKTAGAELNTEVAGFKISCSILKMTGGEAVPNKLVNVHIELKGCQEGAPDCVTEGVQGIFSFPLAGELGWLDKAKTRAGFSLFNEAEPGGPLFKDFRCFLVAQRAFGAVVGAIGPVGVLAKERPVSYSVENYLGEGLTNPPWFEEGADPVGVIRAQLFSEGEWRPAEGEPAGLISSFVTKGENLMIR
jgi:hypothetical protein